MKSAPPEPQTVSTEPGDASKNLEDTPVRSRPSAWETAGIIRSIDPGAKKVWISVGEGRPEASRGCGSTYLSRIKSDPTVTKVRVKGSIEVTRVLKDDLSEARILTEEPTNPMAEGDPVEVQGRRAYFYFEPGIVRWIDPVGKRAWVSAGEADGIKPGTRFNVFRKRKSTFDPGDRLAKGSIEVTRVLAAHLSEARILTEERQNPIAKGDPVYPPERSIVGVVVDRLGNPVEGATISVSDRMTGREIPLPNGQSIVTDKEGRFTIEDLPLAPISLTARIEYASGIVSFPSVGACRTGETTVELCATELSRSRPGHTARECKTERWKLEGILKLAGRRYQPHFICRLHYPFQDQRSYEVRLPRNSVYERI